MLDVGAVAQCLPPPRDLPADQAAALRLFAALHDLGKIGRPFQRMLTEGRPQTDGRHWEITDVLLWHHKDRFIDRLETDEFVLNPLFAATSGHHGRPPSIDRPPPVHRIGLDAVEDSAAVIDAFFSLWPEASLAGLSEAQAIELSLWLPGYIAAADWIGSNTDWFPAQAAGPDLPTYFASALTRAQGAIDAAGLNPATLRPGPLFDFKLRPMQEAAQTIDLPSGPTLTILEDETGSGKTEAALILAQRLLAAGKGRGLYVALPTMATANAMFERAAKVVPNLFSDAPSVTLAHGRANLSDRYRAMLERVPADTDEPVATRWLADDRRRALLATVGIGTIDQALMAVLKTKHATLRHYALSDKILIVDEVHEMGEPYMHEQLTRLLQLHKRMGGSAILLTATLPLDQRAALVKAWGETDDADAAYPALSIVGGERQRDIAPRKTGRGPTKVAPLTDEAQAIALIQEASNKGAACVWVRNAVDDAIRAVDLLGALGVKADLLHARFTLNDRLRHEARALATFGKDGTERAGRVLVATQVVESSLDLDFDVMISDLAPMAALVQRAGRLWRHMDLRAAASRPVPEPVLHVLGPDPDQVTDKGWLARVLDRGAYVYPHDLQLRTAKALKDTGQINAPGDLRRLIESVHSPHAPQVPHPLEQAETERIGNGYAAKRLSDGLLIDLTRDYRGNADGWADDRDFPTRLGQPTRTLYLCRRTKSGIKPWAGPDTADALSEVQASEYRLSKLPLPDQSNPEIEQLKSTWPEWKRESVAVCPVAADGAICDGLTYDATRGLAVSLT